MRSGCPKCGARIEATQKVYWTLDQDTNEFRPEVYFGDSTYEWSIYCANDHQLGEVTDSVIGVNYKARAFGMHVARPNDEQGSQNHCKDCGKSIVWLGPNASDWEHDNG